jgi:hypothetical protein
MSESEQTYNQDRARNLEALLVALAERIRELDAGGQGVLLRHAAELTRLIGEVRSELFHYEVRATYDTPEVADSRRIVREATEHGDPADPTHPPTGPTWQKTEWTPDEEDDRA